MILKKTTTICVRERGKSLLSDAVAMPGVNTNTGLGQRKLGRWLGVRSVAPDRQSDGVLLRRRGSDTAYREIGVDYSLIGIIRLIVS
jgi:hypothetical protein